jgi:hypothetical protein
MMQIRIEIQLITFYLMRMRIQVTYLMRMRIQIQVTKMMRILHADPQHWLLNGGALPSARGDEAESLGLYGDAGALDVLLHVPVDKGRFPRRMVP